MLTEGDFRVRHASYRHFAAAGAAPTVPELATATGKDVPSVEESLDRLAAEHLVALDPGTHDIWMIHPFSARPSGYPVEVDGVTYQANCAWDAFAIPPLLGTNGIIRCACPDCGERMEVPVEGSTVEGGLIVHFVVSPTRFWDDIGFT